MPLRNIATRWVLKQKEAWLSAEYGDASYPRDKKSCQDSVSG